MRISDWSSDVCSSDLQAQRLAADDPCAIELAAAEQHQAEAMIVVQRQGEPATARMEAAVLGPAAAVAGVELPDLLLRVEGIAARSAEHTYELQSLMRKSYDVFCLQQNNKKRHTKNDSKRATT